MRVLLHLEQALEGFAKALVAVLQGRDAAHALRVTAAVALDPHSTLPTIWRKDADTAEGLAHFLVSNIRRGTWQREDAAVSILRESFPGEPTDCPPCVPLEQSGPLEPLAPFACELGTTFQ